MKFKKFYNGFTIVELIIGLMFTTIAAGAIIVGTGHYYKTVANIKLKEAAYERLKSYTELNKGKIANDNLPNNGCESGQNLCLGPRFGRPRSIGQDDDCEVKANELCIRINEPAGSQASTLVKRYELLTTIKWNNINEVENELSFYAIQMVYGKN